MVEAYNIIYTAFHIFCFLYMILWRIEFLVFVNGKCAFALLQLVHISK